MNHQPAATSGLAVSPAVDLKALGMFLSSIGSYNAALIFGFRRGSSIYHYTDLAGLLGIVTNHDLWLTNSVYSNDEEEMKHGMDVVEEVLAEQLSAAKNQNRNDMRARLDALSSQLESPLNGPYVCCFCKRDDLLSQWRGYGANGTGVSLKMKPNDFDVITGPDLPVGTFGLLRFWKVFYDRATQLSIIRDAIQYPHAYPQEPATPKEWAERAADAIEFFLPTFKSKGFREESEFRLIFTPAADCPVAPDFRVGRGLVVPYYSLRKLILQADQVQGGQVSPRLKQLPITRVRVGPNPNKRLNVESIRMMLKLCGYGSVSVEVSKIPFRG